MDHQWEDGDADTFWIPPFMVFCLVCLWSTISPFSLRHVVFWISLILSIASCSVFYPLSVCLSLPPHSLDWLEWVKRANLFSWGLKLPACLFGCGEAQMIAALPSGTVVQVGQNQRCFAEASAQGSCPKKPKELLGLMWKFVALT